MKRTAVLLVVLAGSAAHAQGLTKLFTDQGKTYVRSDDAAALVPGAELPAFSDAAGTRSAGKVIVMEVTGKLARVTFEDDAMKSAAKFVRVGQGAPASAPPPPPGPAPTSAAAMPPPPPPPPPPLAAPPAAPGPLQATLVRGGGYILVRNDSRDEWSGCKLEFPDRRYAPIPLAVLPGRAVQVGYGDIKPAPDLGDDWILARCAEGEAELWFNQPTKVNSLRGRAEGRGGGVLIFNDGDTDWSGCELIKPNGTRFTQGGLRAHSSDSVRAGLFRPPSGPEIIRLSCAQGAVSKPVP